MDRQKIIKAGKIASEVREYAKKIVKKNASLLEIAEKVEAKIIEIGGKPAFPVNTSINEVAAHYTPSHNDESKAHGLIKIDFGVSIDGWCSDNSISIDLENSPKNKKLIESAQKALKNAIKKIEMGISVNEIGRTIQQTIESEGFSPIINLSGHKIDHYDLHAGITIPNVEDKSTEKIDEGLYAIEPFATNGSGKVRDGKPSGIYMLINSKTPRNNVAREILKYIEKEYQTLPFCSRWLVKKFGSSVLFSLKQLEDNGNLHHFRQLVESGGGIVAQAEHTVLIDKKEKIVTTE